jgi:VanZ family protein
VHVWDKAKHFAAFFTLGLLAALAFPRRTLVVIGAALSAFGAAIELVQALPIVHRDCDIHDWIADTLAVALVLAFVAVARVRERTAAVLAKIG